MKVVLTDQLSSNSMAKLKSENVTFLQTQSERPTSSEISNAEILCIRSRTQINAELLKMAPNLKHIISATSGLDHVDEVACKNRNVKVYNAPEANTVAVAEHTLLLILSMIKHPLINPNNDWKSAHLRGHELWKKSLGIIGLGRIGSRVAKLAQAFGMEVMAYDPYREESWFDNFNVESVGLSELLRQADFISLHVPLTDETKHMINAKTLELMTPDTYLINTCRGGVVREVDLLHALQNKSLKGAAIDVFESEPLAVNSALRLEPKLIMSPHTAAFTQEAFERSSMAAVSKIQEILACKP